MLMKTQVLLSSTLCFVIAIIFWGCASQSQNEKFKDPDYQKAMIHYQQGTEELVQKNYSDALRNLLKADEYYPKDDLIKNNLGMAYFMKGQMEKAKVQFQKALSLNVKNFDA